jgi:hypothetical protein
VPVSIDESDIECACNVSSIDAARIDFDGSGFPIDAACIDFGGECSLVSGPIPFRE